MDIMQHSDQQTNMPGSAKFAFCEVAIKWLYVPVAVLCSENANLVGGR